MRKLKAHFSSYSMEAKSVLWMLASCFLSSVMAVVTKHVVATMPALEMVFFRNLFAFMALIPWALTYGLPHVKAANFRLYFSRAISSLCAMSLFFYSIALIPLTDAVALTFAVPLITTIFAAWFLKEKVGGHRTFALLVGFCGVIVILRPGHESFHYAYIMVLIATVAWSVSNILIKKLTHTDHPRAMVFIMMMMMAPLTFPAALYFWQPPTVTDILWMALLALLTNESQFCMNKAYKSAEMSAVMPFDFSRLVFTSILAYLFFAEIIDFWTLVGSIIIFCSSVYIVQHESKRRKKATEVEAPEV